MPEGLFEPRYVSADDLDFFIEQTDNDLERRMLIDMRQHYPLKYACIEEPEYMDVPEGHYLMIGDNSLQSVDGRIYGWVPENHILGRATCIWWPLTRLRDFTGWTDTWWGILLLIGIPGGLVGLEVHRYVRKRRAKPASADKAAA